MGQPITVSVRAGGRPEVRFFETNRSLTGMAIETYRSERPPTRPRPPDVLARRLFDLGAHIVTVTRTRGDGRSARRRMGRPRIKGRVHARAFLRVLRRRRGVVLRSPGHGAPGVQGPVAGSVPAITIRTIVGCRRDRGNGRRRESHRSRERACVRGQGGVARRVGWARKYADSRGRCRARSPVPAARPAARCAGDVGRRSRDRSHRRDPRRRCGYFESDDVANDSTALHVLMPLIIIPIGTALFEETLFRGVLLGAVMETSTRRTAVVVSSWCSGAGHSCPRSAVARAGRDRRHHRVHDCGRRAVRGPCGCGA